VEKQREVVRRDGEREAHAGARYRRPSAGAAADNLKAVSEEIDHGFTEGQPVWVEDGEGRRHPGVFVGDNESAGWFGGGPSAYVVHPEAHQAEVVSIFRITPREE
jgi:hypothetical protein